MNPDLIPDDGADPPDVPYAFVTCNTCGERVDVRDIDRHFDEVHEPLEQWVFELPFTRVVVTVPATGDAWVMYTRNGDEWSTPIEGRRV